MAQLASPPGLDRDTVVSAAGRGSDPSDERPYRSANARMHPLTLRFAPSLEREFEEEYFLRTLGQVRLAFVLAIVLYGIFGVLDLLIAPDHRRSLWTIRFAIVIPVLLVALWLSYRPSFRRWRQHVLDVVVTVASFGIVAMTVIIPVPGSFLYYAGLLLAVMYTFTLVRLPITHATAIATATTAAYVVAAVVNATAPELVVNNLFFLCSAVIIGFSANYSMERYARTNFLQRRLIAERTAELERTNALLLAKNRMLAESRAENIRTAQRTELIFSALSDALPGTVLDDKYRIDEKIGSGSFGTVYRGEHLFLQQPVAIKVFRPAIGGSAIDSLDRFRVEGISACRVNHPNAVMVLDFDVSAGSLAYLVMELLEGRSLADELRQSRTIEPRRAMRIVADVCAVLAEAHASGIVHRDIKPSNVFLQRIRGEEQVKVIDFGLAKLIQRDIIPEGSPAASVAGTLIGTPEYMPPERVSGQPYDGRADVYSLGVMLYEMLTGDLPFRTNEGGYWALAMMHVSRQPERPSRFERSVPQALDALVLAALAKDPDRRPSASELGASLRALAEA